SGEAVVGFTLSNGAGTTGGTVTVTVEARPDPGQDPEVRGVATSQVTSARRFADAQINNFQRRLQDLHDGTNGSSNGVSLNVGLGGEADSDNDPREALRRQLGGRQQDRVDPGALGDDRSRDMLGLDLWADRRVGPAATAATDPSTRNLGAVGADGGTGGRASLGFWTAGSVDWGRQDAQGQRDYRFTTQGVTAGLDVRLSDQVVIGGGLGYGEDKTKIGDNGSVSTGHGVTGALYGSWRPAEAFYIDGVIGWSDLDFSSRRWTDGIGGDPSAYAAGDRSGDTRFVSAAFGRIVRRDAMVSEYYARLDARSISLDGFTETGAGLSALTWDAVEQ
ncbi:MAG: autotransporter outer membrane beta-barrel domain-containing protein, partial [Caulobacteraceae bacterium]